METSSAVSVAGVHERERGRPRDASARSAKGSASPVSRRGQRAAPGLLAALAVVAGIGAVALGVAAFLVGWTGGSQDPAISPEAQSVLSLLAKPSTERVPLGGSAGTAVLAVGSGGRAAIVLKGFEPAPSGSVYHAWVRTESGRFAGAGTFAGTERVVLLARRVERGGAVGVTLETSAVDAPSAPPSLVAIRR